MITILADFPFDSNVIVILVAVIFAGIKAFLERNQKGADEEVLPDYELEEEDRAAGDQRDYEAEVARRQAEMQIELPAPRPVVEQSPPPLPGAIPVSKAKKPTLSAAEKKALENLKRRSEQKAKPGRRRSSGPTRSRVIRHLSSPTAAREALVLAEVLGPPKALKKGR